MPKLSALVDGAEDDVLAYMTFPAAQQTRLHATNPFARVNRDTKRRTDVIGIFPDEASVERLVGAMLLEQDDERALRRSRSMTLEGIAPVADSDIVSLPTRAARLSRPEVAAAEAAPRTGTRSLTATRSQALAAGLRAAGSDGIAYPSCRQPGGECVALFFRDSGCATARPICCSERGQVGRPRRPTSEASVVR